MEVIFNCPLCKDSYNTLDKLPMSLECGHTICKTCISVLKEVNSHLRCPEDDLIDERSEYTINWALVLPDEFPRGLIQKKELCPLHHSPVNMICRSCDMNLCSRCVREHIAHDMYELDNPEILKEIKNKIYHFEEQLSCALEFSHSCVTTINNELEMLDKNLSIQEALIERKFDEMFAKTTCQFQKDQDILRSCYRSKIEIMEALSVENSNLLNVFSEQFYNIVELNKDFTRRQHSDRAITCSKVLSNLLGFPETCDVFDTPVNLQIEHFQEYKIGDIRINELSPLDLLEKEFNRKLKDIRVDFDRYQKAKAEEKLSIEIKSTSFQVFLHAKDENTAISHILRQVSLEILGFDLFIADQILKNMVTERLGVANSVLTDLEFFTKNLKKQITYAKALRLACKYYKENRFLELLQILHYFVTKWTYFNVGEKYLQIMFLRLCSESFEIAKEMKMTEFEYMLETITYYLRFHVHHESLLTYQVARLFEFYKNQLSQMEDDNSFLRYIQVIDDSLQVIHTPCNYNIGFSLPKELTEIIEQLQEKNFLFWEDEGLSKEFYQDIYELRDKLTPWRRTLANINKRKILLSETEMITLESYLCRTNN